MQYSLARTDDGRWVMNAVTQRGNAVLMDPLLNQGTAFSEQDRERLGLVGMLPYGVTSNEQQVRRAYEHIGSKGNNPLEKYVGMMSLLDRNETLFYQVLAANIAELTPIVYTPTVGEAAVQFSHVFRRGRGIWITPDHRGRIHEILGHVRSDDVRLIVVTDNERILGLGDQGAGGMVIPMGKLALYTLGAGIHPAYTLPISLDVGTDNDALLDDDLYVGWRGARLRGDPYEALVEEFVQAVRQRWPHALLQWEDFKKANAFDLLDRYRDTLPSFNDDIQGTAAVVAAGVHSYCRATGTTIADQRFVLAGAGAAGVGIARLLLHEIESAGVGGTDLCRSVVLVDSGGVVTDDRADLEDYKRTVACPAEVLGDAGDRGSGDLVGLVERLRPTVLIGTTGQRDVFGPEILSVLASQVERPLVMALSNPSSKSEATPASVAAATDGRALIATGSPFEPVSYGGRHIPVSQCNNVYIFPGVGLGAIVAKSQVVSDAMFAAAASELAALVHAEDLAAGRLFPPLEDLRAITRRIGTAVARAAVATGNARIGEDAIESALDREIWDLSYPELRPA